jgi:protoporphyrinogen/coproporphyrinogen III oxidase
MAGIFAADPEALSLRSTFAMLPDFEKKYGSVLRGWIMQKRLRRRNQDRESLQSKSTPMFMTLRGGLQQLVDALTVQLSPVDIRLNCGVIAVMRIQDHYKILLHDGSCLHADDVVFATPAYATADLVREIDPELATGLRAIRYVSTATVSLGFRQSDLKGPLDGYGFVVPHQEGRKITACSWSSAKFYARAPRGRVLLRAFVGGARAETLVEQDEAALVDLVRRELRRTMGITARPLLAKAYRWHRGNPQFDVGHQARIADIDRLAASHPGLHLAGAAFRGAGIPDCIESGASAATAIFERHLSSQQRSFSPYFPECVYG